MCSVPRWASNINDTKIHKKNTFERHLLGFVLGSFDLQELLHQVKQVTHTEGDKGVEH